MFTWLPWNVILSQRNLNLFSVNVAMAGTGLYQLSRKIRFVPKPSQQVSCWYVEWRTWFTYGSPLQARLLLWWEGCCSTIGSIDNDSRQRITDWEVCSLGVYSWFFFLGRQRITDGSCLFSCYSEIMIRSMLKSSAKKENAWSNLLCIFLWEQVMQVFICYYLSVIILLFSQSLIWDLEIVCQADWS